MRKRTVAGLVLLAGWAGQAAGAVVSGQILDPSQRPVYGAKVDIAAIPGAGGAASFFRASLQAKLTAKDGTFSFPVNAGTYRICASVRGDGLLNPCVWSKTAPQVTVTQNQTLSMKPLVLMRGYALTVEIRDPAGAVAQELSRKSGKTVLVGLTTGNGMFHPMPLARSDAKLRRHVMMVPRDTALPVAVSNVGFAMTDGTGKAALAGQAYRFNAVIAGERNPRVFTFSVSGLAVQGN